MVRDNQCHNFCAIAHSSSSAPLQRFQQAAFPNCFERLLKRWLLWGSYHNHHYGYQTGKINIYCGSYMQISQTWTDSPYFEQAIELPEGINCSNGSPKKQPARAFWCAGVPLHLLKIITLSPNNFILAFFSCFVVPDSGSTIFAHGPFPCPGSVVICRWSHKWKWHKLQIWHHHRWYPPHHRLQKTSQPRLVRSQRQPDSKLLPI